MAQQAQDTFVTEINGAPVVIQKGQVLPDGHAAVKADVDGVLFAPLELDEPPKKPAARAKAAAAAKA